MYPTTRHSNKPYHCLPQRCPIVVAPGLYSWFSNGFRVASSLIQVPCTDIHRRSTWTAAPISTKTRPTSLEVSRVSTGGLIRWRSQGTRNEYRNQKQRRKRRGCKCYTLSDSHTYIEGIELWTFSFLVYRFRFGTFYTCLDIETIQGGRSFRAWL